MRIALLSWESKHSIAVGGLAYQSKWRLFNRFGFDSILIAITYVGGMVLLLMDAG